jgi:GGDEF domain-containing protein/CHASE3 domain sensor protein
MLLQYIIISRGKGIKRLQLTISRKLLWGYLFMALLTIVASAYAIFNLQKLNQTAYDITNHNFVLVETTKSMMDTVLAQESTEKKYIILKDPSLEQIFWQRATEFKAALETIKRIGYEPGKETTLENLGLLHERYGIFFYQEVMLVKDGRLAEALALSDSSSKAVIDEIALQLKNMQKNTEKEIADKMNGMAGQSSNAIYTTLGLSLFSLCLGILLAILITRSISKPLKQLQYATGLIAEGKLDHQIKVRRNDEIGALAKSFAYMTQRLKILEEINLDASPLTGLPGNLAIENRIKELLTERKMFSLCQVDLDNFKPFADKYGYAWGSEVIKEVADILNGYIDENSIDVFIGHIGGDDFVVLADPESAKNICQRMVADFEKRIVSFFDTDDAKNGYIIGKDRQGIMQKFPLITISAAIVTDDGSRYKNPLDMAMTAAQLKEYAKLLPGSNFVTEEDLDRHNNSHLRGKQGKLELEIC